MKPKLDAAQERRGIPENKRQRPGKKVQKEYDSGS